MKNVLVFPCGSEVGLEVNRALAGSKHFNLYGASSIDDHGKFVYQNYIGGLPFIEDCNFIEEINKITRLYSIDFIVPAHDSAVLKMAKNQDIIEATVVTSCASTCEITRSKSSTYAFLEKVIPTPLLYNCGDAMPYPIFLKPDVGQGSKGTCLANSREEFEFYIQKDPTLIALEYLPGREYTVDCFTDRNGHLLYAGARERVRIKGGISVNSQNVSGVRFYELALKINNRLSLQGAWFYQVKERANGDLVLMEVAPRVAGTMALSRVYGVNLVQLSLFDRMGINVSCLRNNVDIEVDRSLFSRYFINYDYSNVYIDFDDTIIVNGLVDTNVMKFLYQSRNLGKKINLISKHKKNIIKSLENFAISKDLFDHIIIINENDNKANFIKEIDAIFIDDSFLERKNVLEKLNIPVFSLDAVESLLVWKS